MSTRRVRHRPAGLRRRSDHRAAADAHAAGPADLAFSGISQSFTTPAGARLDVLEDISFDVAAGSFVSVVGPSGCGKTTLLRIALRHVRPDKGAVLVGGSDNYAPGRDVAVVYQQYGLFPWQTVLENASFGLRMRKQPDAVERTLPYLELAGLKDFGDYYPHQISGGMQQRVGLARALSCQPRVLLMDEPFAAVDAMTREALQQQLLEIWRQERVTVLFITHDIGEAVHLSDRVIVMGRQPGLILADVRVETPRPRTPDSRVSVEFLEAERCVRSALR